MNFESLILDRRDGVATITLNRPDAFNALTLGLGRELFHAALEVDEDPSVRCVVVTGAGKAFCAGGDVKDFADNLPRIGVLVKELTTYLHGAVSRFARSDKPVIMAVNGVAAGGGFSFALSGDLVLAAESARFTMAYSKIAATPDGSSSYFLPRLVGLRRAMELYFTNRVLTAREALDWGLVTRVVPDAEFKGAVDALARELAQGPSKAFGAAKRQVQQRMTNAFRAMVFRRREVSRISSRSSSRRRAGSSRVSERKDRRPRGVRTVRPVTGSNRLRAAVRRQSRTSSSSTPPGASARARVAQTASRARSSSTSFSTPRQSAAANGAPGRYVVRSARPNTTPAPAPSARASASSLAERSTPTTR